MNDAYNDLLVSNNLTHEAVIDALTKLQLDEVISIQLYDVLVTALDIAGAF